MKRLIDTPPRRIFTFGCSFTRYRWGTWANIIGAEFPNAEFYNIGKRSAGNQYIHNLVMQTDAVYDFTTNDLVMIQWSNPHREDRFVEEWMCTGNIYTQTVYPKDFEYDFFSKYGAYIRDFAFVHGAHSLLNKKTQFHMIPMLDFTIPSSWMHEGKSMGDWIPLDEKVKALATVYKQSLNTLMPSIYKVLWNNDLENKFFNDSRLVGLNFKDGHPSPWEHYNYLTTVFAHTWKTREQAKLAETRWVSLMKAGLKQGYRSDQPVIDGFAFDEFLEYTKKDNKHFVRDSDPLNPVILR